jgi:hypothetical protein
MEHQRRNDRRVDSKFMGRLGWGTIVTYECAEGMVVVGGDVTFPASDGAGNRDIKNR